MERLQRLMDDVHIWADQTFGKERSSTAPVHHLKKECDELIAAIEDLSIPDTEVKKEFADCFILIINAASKYGLTVDELMYAAENKMVINKQRKWGKPDENGVVLHIKE